MSSPERRAVRRVSLSTARRAPKKCAANHRSRRGGPLIFGTMGVKYYTHFVLTGEAAEGRSRRRTAAPVRRASPHRGTAPPARPHVPLGRAAGLSPGHRGPGGAGGRHGPRLAVLPALLRPGDGPRVRYTHP